MKHTEIGIIGCGFVADYYLSTLQNYPHLVVAGLYDRDAERAKHLGNVYSHRVFDSLDEILASTASIIVNLTNPHSHYEINAACLNAGRNVYCEKPLAMTFEEARELVELAEKKGLLITGAPCSLLGEQAQTLIKAVQDDMIGKVWLVYAEMDDGAVPLQHPENWRSASGIPWPVNDEFQVGCTLEHAGYIVPWLVALFGSVESVTIHTSTRITDKHTQQPLTPPDTPDFSVAVLRFADGVEARLTCSIVAPHNHEVKFFGEKGMLMVDECWHYGNPVSVMQYSELGSKAEKYTWMRKNPLFARMFGLTPKKLPFVKKPPRKYRYKKDYMDYARGIDALARAIEEGTEPLLSPRFCLHVNEVVLAIGTATGDRLYRPVSRIPEKSPDVAQAEPLGENDESQSRRAHRARQNALYQDVG